MSRGWARPSCAALVAASFALAPGWAGAADAVAPAPPAPPAAEAEAGGWGGTAIDVYSRAVYRFNQGLYDILDHLADPFGTGEAEAVAGAEKDGAGAIGGLSHVLSNVVNEPLTVVTSAAIGEFSNAWRSVERFAINSTLGVLGYWDTASAMGYPPKHTDIGLSLCRAGVAEGGYVVLPFIGPRTGRDAIADIVLMNAILWTFAGVAAGTGASFQTIVIAELIEVVADISATRQFDSEAKKIPLDDYERTRDAYLAQRQARCAALIRADADAAAAAAAAVAVMP